MDLTQLLAGRREDLLAGLAAGGMVAAVSDAHAQVHEGIVAGAVRAVIRCAFVGAGAHAAEWEYAGGERGLVDGRHELGQIQLPAQVR